MAMEYNPAKWMREQTDEKLREIFEEWRADRRQQDSETETVGDPSTESYEKQIKNLRANVAATQERMKAIAKSRDEAVAIEQAAQEQVRVLIGELQEATRICDQPGCISPVIRLDDGRRVCASKHESRWVDKADLIKANEPQP